MTLRSAHPLRAKRSPAARRERQGSRRVACSVGGSLSASLVRLTPLPRWSGAPARIAWGDRRGFLPCLASAIDAGDVAPPRGPPMPRRSPRGRPAKRRSCLVEAVRLGTEGVLGPSSLVVALSFALRFGWWRPPELCAELVGRRARRRAAQFAGFVAPSLVAQLFGRRADRGAELFASWRRTSCSVSSVGGADDGRSGSRVLAPERPRPRLLGPWR